MGAVRCIFSESEHRFLELGGQYPLSLEGTRKFQTSPLRYCLQENILYLPKGFSEEDYAYSKRFCWARLKINVLYDLHFHFGFNTRIPDDYSLEKLTEAGVGLGARYLKRHQEVNGSRISVSKFCSASLIDGIRSNPEAISNLSKKDFEALCAELFVSRGFEVDLYRSTKDDGIDFLALRTDDIDPLIFAVQCKHPDSEHCSQKQPRTLSVATVREIYGVAKAHNITGGIAITSSKYSHASKKFADLKPDEIAVYDRSDILRWIEKYRWNNDEKP
ncbi:restriction endonuclease [Nostoc sp. JL33]|uniref:restriction endonuclease n=1 Tax=Nostoc sp. JL33 TaxID=2815396 RepID=UPI0025D7F0C5|nr:restriction endonuclease [Nostoc sp. JL33]MBN3874508.1 restriction endonuclease [Nostoc sp. JL33]